MGSAEVEKHAPTSGDGVSKDVLNGFSNGLDHHKHKDKDHSHKHKDKDREKSKDKNRDKHREKEKHKDKHRDKDKSKSKEKDRKHKDDHKHEKEDKKHKDKKREKEDRKHDKEDHKQKADRKHERDDKKRDKEKSKGEREKVEVKEEPPSSDEEMPLASLSCSQSSQDELEEDDDVPLASRMKIKFEADVKVEKSKKRKAEEMDEEDDYEDEDDYVAVKKENKKIKEEKQQKSSKKASQNGTPSPTKRVKKEKKEEEETWKWWEEEKHEDGVKWKTLEHKGPVFAADYEPLPKNVKFKYNGKEMKLSTSAEEVAAFYAHMLDHDYVTKEVFNKNFFKDWRKFMTQSEKEVITDLKKCDFTDMHSYFKAKSEEKKNRTKEEKQKLKLENEEIVKQYGWCIIDGHKQRIGNFKIEPPGLFRGRGDHPKMGMVKRRVMPEDVIINCSKGTAPKPPPGHKWKEVRHDNSVTWLASWTENVQGQVKYIMLNSASRLKGERDWQKYEVARKLKDSVDKIRETYKEDWKSKEMKIRQRAVALYFIDKLALRAGNEKDEDQADTVGCCSLRVEHIQLHEEKDGKQYVVVFDFLGKDSIRYYNEVPVEKRVFKNLQIFMENKKPGDDLFDRLNTTIMNKHLNDLMEGLTAKVFRTYNASNTLQEQLNELTDPKASVAEKILAYNRANRAVAILCNHQRAVPKTFAKSMENLQKKIEAKREAIEEAQKSFKDLKKEAKKSGSTAAKIAAGKKEKQVEKLKEQLMKLEVQATDREENKEIALGTSKLNYLDPRISVAWCKKHDVPIEKIYNKTQREKFQWAIDMAGPEFEF